jgi:hypothetical protein
VELYHVYPDMECWHGKGQRDLRVLAIKDKKKNAYKFGLWGHHVRQGTEDKVLGSVLILLT